MLNLPFQRLSGIHQLRSGRLCTHSLTCQFLTHSLVKDRLGDEKGEGTFMQARGWFDVCETRLTQGRGGDIESIQVFLS